MSKKSDAKVYRRISRELYGRKPTIVFKVKKKYSRKRDKKDEEREAWKNLSQYQ